MLGEIEYDAQPVTKTFDVSTLTASCSETTDLTGLLSQLLWSHRAQLLDADQHTDHEAGVFFQRIRFRMATSEVERAHLRSSLAGLASRFNMRWELSHERRRKRVAILVSKYDHGLFDLLWRHRAGELPCEVALVISNHPDLSYVADQFGVPFHVLPVDKDNKAQQERAHWALIDGAGVDLIVLARYMQILSPEYTRRYPNRIINIHHSFLPAFVGSKPYHRASARGVKLIGATAHYATSDLDEGPIIEQDVIRTSHKDTVEDLVRKGRDLEKLALARAVRWHLEDRVLVYGNKTVVFA